MGKSRLFWEFTHSHRAHGWLMMEAQATSYGKNTSYLTVKELLQTLRIAPDARASFKRQLRSLVASGALVEIRGHRFGVPDRMNLVVGRVSTNPRGFAFVDPETVAEGGPASIFVAGNSLNQAVHGDRVVVRVERHRDADRAEGRIVRILERGAVRSAPRHGPQCRVG